MQENKIHSFISFFVIKENAQFIFLRDPKFICYLIVCLMKILKSPVTKKVIACVFIT